MAITFTEPACEEYAVRKYGRPRPPAWLQRLGGVWKRVFELLCLRRLEPQAVVDLLCAADAREPDVRAAIREVRRAFHAAASTPASRRTTARPSSSAAPALQRQSWSRGSSRILLQVLAGLSSVEENTTAQNFEGAAAKRARTRIAALERSLELTGQERLLLRLVYEENCSTPGGSAESRPERTHRARVHGRLMERLRAALAEQGARRHALRARGVNEHAQG